MQRYTAHAPSGQSLTGTAAEITDWLQEQDWEFGQAGPSQARVWRETVLRRVVIQTGQEVDTAAASVDETAFLEVLAAAGLLTLERLKMEGEE